MKYRFRLARVLSIKEIFERQAELGLAAWTVELKREESKLARRSATLSSAWTQLTQTGVRRAEELKAGAGWLVQTRQSYDEQRLALASASQAWAKAREDLLARRAERQSIDRLRDKRRAEYVENVRRRESAVIDEVAGLAYLRDLRKEENRG